MRQTKGIVLLLILLAQTPLSARGEANVERPLPAPLLTPAEQSWLDERGRTLRIGAEASYHPYAFVEDGVFRGLTADYLNIVAERLDLRIELREYPSFDAISTALRDREIDVLPFVVESPERRAFMLFSDPITVVNDRLLTRRDENPAITLEDLHGRRIGAVDGYAVVGELRRDHPELEVVAFPNELEGIRALALGGIDAMVSDGGVASWHVQNEAITNLQIGGDFREPDPQTFGVRSDWPELVTILNKGLATIPEGQRRELEGRWISVVPDGTSVAPRVLITIALVIALAILTGAFWVASLRRLVSSRTRALREELEERRRVEDSNDRLAAAIEQSGEFVAMLEASGRVEYANLALSEAVGPGDPIGRPFTALLDASDGAHLAEALAGLGEAGLWRGDVTLASGLAGGPRQLALTIAAFSGRSEVSAAPSGFIVTARDVTEARELEARLLQGEKLSSLGTLAGGIAHDFNNLLVPILGNVELLRDDVPDSAMDCLDAIEDAGERSRQLVQRIMTFSRRSEPDRVPIDLAAELAGDLSFLRSLLPASIEIEQDLEPCPTVLADRTQLQQILLNLGTNAADALPPSGGRLTVTLRPIEVSEEDAEHPGLAPGAYCLLSVADNGKGIDAADIPRLFDPYFTRKETGRGTGLGLATVHGIVEAHGGTIAVASVPGEGTRFDIFLPARPAAESERPTREEPGARRTDTGGAGGADRILLVDDDAAVLRTVKRMLESAGHEVDAFGDPREALHALGEAPDRYDAIVSDYTMPGMLGTDLLEEAARLAPRTARLLLTGQGSELRVEGVTLLAKPVRASELRRTVQALLDAEARGAGDS